MTELMNHSRMWFKDSMMTSVPNGARTIPESAQADGYNPDQPLIAEGYDSLNLRVPCYKDLDGSHFLGIVAVADPNGKVEIKVFIAEIPERRVVSVRHGNNRKPEKHHLSKDSVSSSEETEKIVSTVLERMKSLVSDYGQKTLPQLTDS